MTGLSSDDAPAGTTVVTTARDEVAAHGAAARWSTGTRTAFRFTFLSVCLFSILRLLPELFDRLPLPLRSGVLWSDAVAPAWNAQRAGP